MARLYDCFPNELTGELCRQRPHVQVSGTGRYFIDLLLKELEKSAAFLGNRKESDDTSQKGVVKILNFREKMTHPLLEKHHYLQKFNFLVK